MNSLFKLSYLFLFVSKKIIKNNYSKSILLNVRNKNINFNDKDDDDTYIKYTKICKKKNVNSDQYMKNSNLRMCHEYELIFLP